MSIFLVPFPPVRYARMRTQYRVSIWAGYEIFKVQRKGNFLNCNDWIFFRNVTPSLIADWKGQNTFGFLGENIKMKIKKFDFEKEVKDNYGDDIEIFTENLSKIAKDSKNYTFPGIYALYENNQLKKIGKAIYKGIHHRMVQYYNMNKKGGSKYISISNRDEIEVRFFTLEDTTELWYAERRFQVIAHDCGESMEWENTSRN